MTRGPWHEHGQPPQKLDRIEHQSRRPIPPQPLQRPGDAVRAIAAEYAAETGRDAYIFDGSSPGAAHTGAIRIDRTYDTSDRGRDDGKQERDSGATRWFSDVSRAQLSRDTARLLSPRLPQAPTLPHA